MSNTLTRHLSARLLSSLLMALCAALLSATAWSNPGQAKASANPMVRFETSLGGFTVELYPDKAPISVTNFLRYVDSGFYAGTIFHRVISSFMIQGGGFTPDMVKKDTNAPIPLEVRKGLSNLRGYLAMARTSNPNSATSQFFINVVNNRNLDNMGGGYAVFGKVTEGMDTVDKIRATAVTRKGQYSNVPVEAVLIKSAQRVKASKPAAQPAPATQPAPAAAKPAPAQ